MRPEHITDWLCRQHSGQWFSYTGSEQTYDQLVIHGDYTKPTEEECNAGLAAMQADWDAKQYQRDRKYPSIQEQLDMQYWDSVNGTTTWADAIAAVKAAHPKGE
jgi:hypothetical protein